MRYLLLIPLMILLTSCASILADDDSLIDQSGYSPYSGFNPDPGMEASSKMINAAVKR